MERDSTWKYMDSTMVSSDNLRGMSWKITLFLGHQSVIFAKWNYGMVLEKSAAQIESTEIEVLRFWAVFCSEFEVFFWVGCRHWSSMIINDRHGWWSWDGHIGLVVSALVSTPSPKIGSNKVELIHPQIITDLLGAEVACEHEDHSVLPCSNHCSLRNEPKDQTLKTWKFEVWGLWN